MFRRKLSWTKFIKFYQEPKGNHLHKKIVTIVQDQILFGVVDHTNLTPYDHTAFIKHMTAETERVRVLGGRIFLCEISPAGKFTILLSTRHSRKHSWSVDWLPLINALAEVFPSSHIVGTSNATIRMYMTGEVTEYRDEIHLVINDPVDQQKLNELIANS